MYHDLRNARNKGHLLNPQAVVRLIKIPKSGNKEINPMESISWNEVSLRVQMFSKKASPNDKLMTNSYDESSNNEVNPMESINWNELCKAVPMPTKIASQNENPFQTELQHQSNGMNLAKKYKSCLKQLLTMSNQ